MFSFMAAQRTIFSGLEDFRSDLERMYLRGVKAGAPSYVLEYLDREIDELKYARALKVEEAISYVRAEANKYVVSEFKNLAHPTPREPVFRRNYDYDEGWHKMMDEFREGKIKGIKDYLDKKQKEAPRIKNLHDKKADSKKHPKRSKPKGVDPELKKLMEARKEMFDPLFYDAYCRQKSHYWKENRGKKKNKAVEDYIDYAESTSCG